MIISNVNIGSGNGVNDGESIYSAFYKVNQNFANVQSNINALTNSVSSVAGRTGNVTLTIADIVGLSTTYASQANIITANTLMKGYVDGQISAANSAPNTANIGMLGYVDLANTIQSSIITVSNSAMKNYVDGQISAANSAPNTANVGMIGYVNLANSIQSAQIASANLGIIGYVDNKVSTANIGIIGYIGQQVSASNVGIIGYVDLANTIQSAQIASANLGIIGYVDNKVSTANIGVIGYIDRANTIQSEIITASNIGIIGYIGLGNTIVTAGITTANLGMIGYVDNKVSTANIGIIGYIGNQVNAANVAWQANALAQSVLINSLNTAFVNLAANAEIQQANIFSIETSIASVNSSISLGNTIQSEQLTAANLGIIGYIGNQVSTANIGIKGYIDLANTIQQERITAGNVGIIGYIGLGNTIVTAGIVSANLGLKGYVDNAVSTANVGIKGYIDLGNTIQTAQISTANIGIKGYIDLGNTIQTAQISAANVGIIGYVDSRITVANTAVTAANLGMKGYVDSVASQSIYGNGNVKSYLTQFDGNIVPNANVTFSLGNVTHRWKDLYLSGNTIFLGDTTITTSGDGILSPVTRELFLQSFLPGSTNSAATFTLDRLPTAGSTRKVFVIGVQGGGPAPSYTLTEGTDFTISGLNLIITTSYTATNIRCEESYSDTGDLITATTIATDTISPTSGDLTVSGNITVDGDLYVSPTSIYMGGLRISAADGNLKVNTAVKFSDDSVQNTAYSNVQTLSLLATSTGNIAYDGVLISNPNYITVSNNWVYTLSSTVSDNILLVTSTGLFATINMPVGAVDGQVATFSANAKLTITAGTGTVQPTFTGANILVSTFRYIYRSADSIWYRS